MGLQLLKTDHSADHAKAAGLDAARAALAQSCGATAQAGIVRKVGGIWREGAKYYHRLPGGVDELRTVEREPLLFGYRVVGKALDMPCLNAAESAEVHAERLECFDDERHEIRRGINMDAVDFSRLIDDTPWLDEPRRPC